MIPGTGIVKIIKILEDKVILEVLDGIPLRCEILESKTNGKKNVILNNEEMVYGKTNILPIEAGFCYKAKVLYIRKVKNRYVYRKIKAVFNR